MGKNIAILMWASLSVISINGFSQKSESSIREIKTCNYNIIIINADTNIQLIGSGSFKAACTIDSFAKVNKLQKTTYFNRAGEIYYVNEIKYDEFNNPLNEIVDDIIHQTYEYTYNQGKIVTKKTLIGTAVVSKELYNKQGQLIEGERNDSKIKVVNTYDSAKSLQKTQVYENGVLSRTINYSYVANSKDREIRFYDEGKLSIIIKESYAKTALKKSETFNMADSLDIEETYFDDFGNILKSIGGKGELVREFNYTYDKFNNWLTKIELINKVPRSKVVREIEYY